MHNWRFLLLAFVAVFQPIASFTERGDVDGRNRCDYRAASLRDSGFRFHGTYSFTKPALGDRRLNRREDVRELGHNEVREDTVRTPQSHLADTLNRDERTPTRIGRFSRDKYLTRNAAVLSWGSRGARLSDERAENGRQRTIDQTRRTDLASRLSQASDDDRRSTSRRSSTTRLSTEARRESQRNRDNTETQRDRDFRTRGVSDRVRDEVTGYIRNVGHSASERISMDMRRSESAVQLEQIAAREMKRSRNAELRSSSARSARVNRVYENEESRLARRDARHSLDREERRTQSRRVFDSENLNRNIRKRVSGDQRVFSGSSVRAERMRDLQTNIPAENRRQELGNKNTRNKGDRVVEVQRENRNTKRDAQLEKENRFQVNRASQRDSRPNDSDRSVETRRGIKDARSTRLVNQATESRREDHNIHRENKRDVRSTERDLRRERTTETRYFYRQSCSLNSEREANERRENRESPERVIRLFTERDAQNRRTFRNVRDSRNLIRQRDADTERATREVRRESPLRRDRLTERNVRMDFGNIRSIEKQRSIEAGDESRRITIENDSRRDTRSNERRSRSLGHDVASRENRRDARTIQQKRSFETRDSRTQRDSQEISRELGQENRRSVGRQSRTMEEERNIEIKRTRDQERNSRSFKRERTETRRGIRNTAEAYRIYLLQRSSENKRERSAESRAVRDIQTDFRTVRGDEVRVDTRIKNMRVRDSLSMDGNSFRTTEEEDSRRTRAVQRKSRRETTMEATRREANHRFNTELNRKREFLSIRGNPAENSNSTMNWQYLFYMLQGLYLCGILAQLMNEKKAGVKNRAQSWWTAPHHLIKVD